MELPENDTAGAYARALEAGDSYAARLAALLNERPSLPEDGWESGFVIEEPDF